MSRDHSIFRPHSLRALPRAFTLIEMITSMIIMVVLLLACASVVSLATYSVSRSTTRAIAQNQTGDAASQLTDDLNVALNFTERTATSTTFTVPDRLLSGSPQTVRYAWNGIAGNPLTRQFNGGTAVPILPNLQSLNLSYLTRLMGPVPPPAEQLCFQHNSVMMGSANDYQFKGNQAAAEYFVPSLPNGTASYTLTRVQLKLHAGKNQDTVYTVLAVLPNIARLPKGPVVGQTTVYGSALSKQYEMVDATFTGLTNLNPSQPLCIEVQSSNDGNWQYESSLFSILSNTCFSSSDKNGNWSSMGLGTNVAMMNVYGTVP